MRAEEITLGSLIEAAGHATGHFGKWHLGPVKAGAPNNPGAAGFDEWLSHDNFFEMDPVLVRNGAAPEQHQGESSEIVVEAAIDSLNYKHPVARRNNFGGDASILDNRYKLVLSKKGNVELFDILQDSGETLNLAKNNPRVVERMTKRLRQWQASVEVSLTGADY